METLIKRVARKRITAEITVVRFKDGGTMDINGYIPSERWKGDKNVSSISYEYKRGYVGRVHI